MQYCLLWRWKAVTHHCWPSGLEETRGVAAGAGVELRDIVMLKARYDLAHIRDDGSTQKQHTKSSNTCRMYQCDHTF
ncbi:hypothetical protein UA08_03130 [Talaromyces atroroseus]|uniref:Uncharacterized protein n=1 Tax=Talaromyces atroroseus TaxID=1441469 RepID=A0A225AZB0_TALAT|nr:hypothetical protein UA08_03130 [Talaromyces atroroseus]OKL61049.1 hypothetical protein UA08_03130 [Talaromyces atroroseus]